MIIPPATALIPEVVAVHRRPPSDLIPVPLVSLFVEVVAHASQISDRLIKPMICAAAGVQHYWRLEQLPFPDQGAEQLPVLFAYDLDDGEYHLVQWVAAGVRARFDSPFEIEFDPGELLHH